MSQHKPISPKGTTVITSPLPQDVIDLRKATATPTEQIEEMTNGLTLVQRFLLKRHMGKLRMQEAKKIAGAIGQAVTEAVTYKLTLALDFDKKKTFTCYMKASADMQRELQRLEAEFRNSLAVELLRIDKLVSEYNLKAQGHISELQAQGLIKEAEVRELNSRYEDIASGLMSDNLATYQVLVSNFKELLVRTLSVFMAELQDAKLI